VANSASRTSPWALWVAPPVLGPSRWTTATTTGVSDMSAYWKASIISAQPGPEVAVIAFTPRCEAPMQ